MLALIMLPMLAGCGSSSTTTTVSESTTTTAAPESTTTTAAPESTTTTTAAPTTTTTAAPAAYDIKTVVAGIQADASIKALLPAAMQTAGFKVASDIPYMPWEGFVGDTNQPTGFDYDLSQALAAKIGVTAAFVETKFDSIILSIQSGKNDVAMSDMYDNLTRQKVLDFVDYAADGTSILVLKGNPKGIVGLDTLAGQAVGCEKGTTQAVMLDNLNKQFQTAGKPAMTISQFPDQPSALLAVQSGKVVGDLTDHSTASYIAMTTDNGATFEVVKDPAAPNGYESQPVGAGVLKKNTGLRDAIQKALQALIDDGTYKTIIDHYGLIPVASAAVNQGTASGA